MRGPGHLTITEAAAACRVHRVTMQRKVREGLFPNAEKDAAGRWLIPVGDLEAAGLEPNRPQRPEDAPHEFPTSATRPDGERVQELVRELFDERRRREVAEAIAQERLERIDDLRAALRLLEAGARQSKRGRDATS